MGEWHKPSSYQCSPPPYAGRETKLSDSSKNKMCMHYSINTALGSFWISHYLNLCITLSITHLFVSDKIFDSVFTSYWKLKRLVFVFLHQFASSNYVTAMMFFLQHFLGSLRCWQTGSPPGNIELVCFKYDVDGTWKDKPNTVCWHVMFNAQELGGGGASGAKGKPTIHSRHR